MTVLKEVLKSFDDLGNASCPPMNLCRDCKAYARCNRSFKGQEFNVGFYQCIGLKKLGII